MGFRDEKELVDACVGGDARARELFHETFLPLIYRFERRGSEHESASQDFLAFLFTEDRLFRRLRGYRGQAPLSAYLWTCILPDLMKQFRAILRRQRLDTVSLDDNGGHAASPGGGDRDDSGEGATALLSALPIEKRVLVKLLHIEDFDLDASEIQYLSERTGDPIRMVIARVAEARETVRSREAVQHGRLERAGSAGQWIRIYARRLQQIESDLSTLDPTSPRVARLRNEHEDLTRKLRKREQQRAAHLRASQHTVVTPPTALIAQMMGHPEPTLRAKITRIRRDLAALLSGATAGTTESA